MLYLLFIFRPSLVIDIHTIASSDANDLFLSHTLQFLPNPACDFTGTFVHFESTLLFCQFCFIYIYSLKCYIVMFDISLALFL